MLARFNRVSICPSHAGIVRYALTYRAGFDTGKLEGKYSLESTDPRESEIRAPPQLTISSTCPITYLLSQNYLRSRTVA